MEGGVAGEEAAAAGDGAVVAELRLSVDVEGGDDEDAVRPATPPRLPLSGQSGNFAKEARRPPSVEATPATPPLPEH